MVDDLNLMDPVTDQALDYLYQFEKSNGLLIHLNRGPIKKRDLNLTSDGQDGLKMGLKFVVKCA